MTDRHDADDAKTPSPDAARHIRTSEEAEASALRNLGTEPGSVGAAAHDAHWRRTFKERDYVDPERDYEYYRPAFRYGWESAEKHRHADFDKAEPELREGWNHETTGLPWDEARPAIRDAFQRAATQWSDPGNPLA